MPLEKSAFATRVKTEFESAFGAPADPDQLQKFADAIAKAIVDELKTNAVITVTGVTAGSGSASGTIS